MKRMIKRRILRNSLAAAAVLMATGMYGTANAAFDENLNNYTIDTVVVEGEQTHNKFGDTITEQSYYRTGGDVKVITREEIEKRHYPDVTEAIKRIPGVTFTNSGYRGGEYNFNAYNNSMSINGDSRVIICIDGRRVDNSTSTRFGNSNATGTRTMADLNQLVSMDQVEKIEVIKGPGASAYGADATGGVINILTRKGGVKNQGTVDISTGSWKKHIYSLTYSGALEEDKSTRFFLNARRNMSGDSKYKDGVTGNNETYNGTNYKEESAVIRLDKEFNDKQNIRFTYNHQNGRDGYPITAREYKYWNAADWKNNVLQAEVGGKYGNDINPGYRNLFSLDALAGSYNSYKSNDIDFTYVFNKDNGMESFVRFYNQSHEYFGRDYYPSWYSPGSTDPLYDSDGAILFPGSPGFSEAYAAHLAKVGMNPTRYDDEVNRGFQIQYGKSVGVNDVLASFTFDHAKTTTRSKNNKTGVWTNSETQKDTINAYVQDKIHITDKWDLTPSLRMLHYTSFETNGVSKSNSDTLITPSLATQYAFDDSFSAYLAWTKVSRPMKLKDYDTTTLNGSKLEDEKGDVITLGLRKDIGDKTSLGVHYDYTRMTNAITQFSSWSTTDLKWKSVAVNARENKKSFNVTAEHHFDDMWNLGLSYTHMKDQWSSKDGDVVTNLDLVDRGFNVNTMINRLRPANHFSANLTFEKGKFYAGLLTNWYTGMNTSAFSCNKALVLDLSFNYDFTKDLSAYLTVSNLTNRGYENAYYSRNGIGAAPQPGRSFMVGAKFKF